MAAAAVLGGNMPPATDVIIPRPSASSSRIRCCLPASTTSASFPFLRSCKRSSRSRTMSSSSDFDGLDGGGEGDVSEEDEMKQWEVEMRQRLREMEDMRELEKRAEELQTRMADEEGAGEEGGEDEDEEEKRNRVRRELERLAKEQAERRETAKLMYELGQKAYGKGMYGRAIEFLEGALTIIPRTTLVGGEIQIWLAMAYDANNRHKDCIVLYQELEKQHPIVSIRRQASELRYISQAPKLKITKDEMVTIPLIGSSYDRYAGTWSDKTKKRDLAAKAGAAQSASSRDPWGNYVGWRPPTGWAKSRMLWIAITLWLAAVGVVLLLQT